LLFKYTVLKRSSQHNVLTAKPQHKRSNNKRYFTLIALKKLAESQQGGRSMHVKTRQPRIACRLRPLTSLCTDRIHSQTALLL